MQHGTTAARSAGHHVFMASVASDPDVNVPPDSSVADEDNVSAVPNRISDLSSGSVFAPDRQHEVREEVLRMMVAAQAEAKTASEQLESDNATDVEALMANLTLGFRVTIGATDAKRGSIDIHTLNLPADYSTAMQALRKYSAFGQVLMSAKLHGVPSALPFAEPVAALIGGIYSRAAQVCTIGAHIPESPCF